MSACSRRQHCRPAAPGWLLLPLLLLAPLVPAQEPEAERHEEGEAAPVIEFDTIRVVAKRLEWVDPFAFQPLFDPDANRFQRDWNESPSVEDVSLSGGYLILGINYGLMKAAEAVTRLPGWKHQVQPATARPPPLDADQAERAARLRGSDPP